MSTKTFSLMIFAWIAVMMVSMDLIETGHWVTGVLLTLMALVITFLVVD
jgi:hypothetical protein